MWMMQLLFLLLHFWTKQGASSSIYGYTNSSVRLPTRQSIAMLTGAQMVDSESIPSAWDWRNVGGRSFVSVDANQHAPAYCGACWIFAATSSLNDRIKILRQGAFPDVTISRQALINCIP